MSPSMRNIAVSQDVIGWINFMEGRISEHFYTPLNKSSSCHLITLSPKSYTLLTLNGFTATSLLCMIDTWGKLLWILIFRCCMSLRHWCWIPHHMSNEIPKDHRFLLEFDLDKLRNSDNNGQQYWLRATEAACCAGHQDQVTVLTRNSSPSGGPRLHSAITLLRHVGVVVFKENGKEWMMTNKYALCPNIPIIVECQLLSISSCWR